jgi:hypothetical protein
MRLVLRLLPVLGIAGVFGLVTTADAASFGSPLLQVSIDAEGDASPPLVYEYSGEPVEGYTGTRYRYIGGTSDPAAGCLDAAFQPVACFTVGWDLDIIVDPIISGPVAVTNPTGSTQTYDVTFTLPATAFAGPTNIGGSIAATVVDGNQGSATIATAGFPLYRALIDGGVVRSLLDHPSSATQPTPISLPGQMSAAFGLEVIASGMTSDIGIRYRFSLTAGDSATVNGNFLAEPVPEPGTLGLAAVGIALLAAARRRTV